MNQVITGTDLIILSSHPYGSAEVRTTSVMDAFAEKKRVYFFEAPIVGVSTHPTYFMKKDDSGVVIIKPYLPDGLSVFDTKTVLLNLLKELICEEDISHYTIWTDTPKSMPFIRSLCPEIIIYDCLKDYSRANPELEAELFEYADVVLTSGMTGAGVAPKKSSEQILAQDFRFQNSPAEYLQPKFSHS